MTNHTLDLRSSAKVTNGQTPLHDDTLSWTTIEYEKPSLRRNWWLIPMAVALILILFGIFTQNYFFIALVILAFGMVLLNAHRTPKTLKIEITSQMVRVGTHAIPGNELDSFGIIESPDLIHPLLSLSLTHGINRSIRVPLIEVDKERVRQAMRELTKEEVHTETLTDVLARKF